MNTAEAKELILSLIDAAGAGRPLVDPDSLDGDPGKFQIAGKPAKVVNPRDGGYVKINLDWFDGSFDPPSVKTTPFHWYAIAIHRPAATGGDHYFICDYLQLREWVLDFAAPKGDNHRNHAFWRFGIKLFPDARTGYFRWGDEPVTVDYNPKRVITPDNLETVVVPVPSGLHVGTFGPSGESSAHRLLKLYVASHPTDFGMSPEANSNVEYSFDTGDRVDVMFQNHQPDRTVVEVEVEGATQIRIGILQAIKYRSLAAVDAGYPLVTARVGAAVVAFETNYPRALELAERYDIALHSVEKATVLGEAI